MRPGLSALRRLRRPARRGLTVLAAATIAGIVVVSGLAQLRVDTGIDSMLPDQESTKSALNRKAAVFGGDPVVVVLETDKVGGLLLDPGQLRELLRLEGRLSRVSDVVGVYGPGTLLNQIAITAQNLLAEISGQRDALRATAIERAKKEGLTGDAVETAGRAAVQRFDRRYGSLLATGMPAGLPTLHNSRFVKAVVFDAKGNPKPQWRFVVPSARSTAIVVRPRDGIDQSSTSRLVEAVRSEVDRSGLRPSRVTISGVPAVTAAMSERAERELPLLGGLTVLVVALTFVVAAWRGRQRFWLWPLAACLVGTAATLAAFGWSGIALSLGAVAFLPILLGVGTDFPLFLTQAGNRRIVLVTALASAAGFASLGVSPLPFIRELGLAMAVGVLLALAAARVMVTWRGDVADHRDGEEPRATTPVPPVRRRWAAAALFGVIAALGWAALPTLPVEADPQRLAQGLPALDDARRLERILGSSGEISVVVRGNDVTSPEVFDWAQRAEQSVIVRLGDRVRPIVTAPGLLRFLGEAPSQGQIQAGLAQLPEYLTSAVIAEDRTQALLTFGITLQDLGSQRDLIAELEAALPTSPASVSVDVVGLPIAAVQALDAISGSRYAASLLGIVAAGIVLLLGLRRRADVGRALTATLLATGWSLAGAWLLDVQLSPLTLALGSLTAATGCEFAVLLSEAHRSRLPGLRRGVAIACLTSAAGFAVLAAFSDLWILRQFGLLLTVSVVASFLAAHLVVRLFPPAIPEPCPSVLSTRSHEMVEVPV